MVKNPVIHEVLAKQYLRSILDISGEFAVPYSYRVSLCILLFKFILTFRENLVFHSFPGLFPSSWDEVEKKTPKFVCIIGNQLMI